MVTRRLLIIDICFRGSARVSVECFVSGWMQPSRDPAKNALSTRMENCEEKKKEAEVKEKKKERICSWLEGGGDISLFVGVV